jgi:hypothetical protein
MFMGSAPSNDCADGADVDDAAGAPQALMTIAATGRDKKRRRVRFIELPLWLRIGGMAGMFG